MCECTCDRCDALAAVVETAFGVDVEQVAAADDPEATAREQVDRVADRDDLADARRETAEVRRKADRAERVAHTGVAQFRENASKRRDAFSRFGTAMSRIDDLEEQATDAAGEVAADQRVDRSAFLPVHRAYMDVRDGVASGLANNERRAARLFVDVLERGEKSLGTLKYDSAQARRYLVNEGDMTRGGKSKTVARALETLAVLSKDSETGDRLFEFKRPKDDGVSSVRVTADLEDVKRYLDGVEELLDDVATDGLVEPDGAAGGGDPPDETDGTADRTDDHAAGVDSEFARLDSATAEASADAAVR